MGVPVLATFLIGWRKSGCAKETPSGEEDIQAEPQPTGRQNHPLGWHASGTEEVESALYGQSLLASGLKATGRNRRASDDLQDTQRDRQTRKTSSSSAHLVVFLLCLVFQERMILVASTRVRCLYIALSLFMIHHFSLPASW